MSQSPGLFQCPACGGPVAYSAASCPQCGYRPPTAAKGVNLAVPGLGVGGLLVAAGSFLPWVTVSGLLSISRSGIDGGGDGLFTLTLGIVLALVAAGAFSSGELGRFSRVIGVLCGLAALGIAVYDGTNLARIGASISGLASVSIGAGIYMVVVGAGLAVIASVLAPGRTQAQV